LLAQYFFDKNELKAIPQQRPNSAMRWLACALLLLVSYGSTFEFVHRHGNNSNNLAGQCTAINDSSDLTSPEGNSVPGQCLVCQFQQHLSTNVTAAPLLLSAPVEHKSYGEHSPSFYAFALRTPRCGRAPPLAS